MATQHYQVTPVWGAVGGVVRFGGTPGASVAVTDVAGTPLVATQDGVSRTGAVVVGADGQISAFTVPDASAVLLTTSGVTWTAYSIEAITSSADAQTYATAASASAVAAAASATAAQTSAQSVSGVTIRASAYGVVGNGLVDDTTAFGSALAAAAAVSGAKTVHIGGLSVKLTSSVTIPANTTITGGGTIVAGASMATLLVMSGESGLSDVTVDAAGLVGSYTVHINSADEVRLHRVTIANAANGVEIRGTSNHTRIENCDFTGSNTPIRIRESASNTLVDRCRFTTWKERAVYLLGTGISAPSNVRISRNYIGPHAPGGSVRQPIQCNGNDAFLFSGIEIMDNTVECLGKSFDDPTTPGSADAISLHRAKRFVISGNVVYGSGDVGITVAQQCTGGTVANNVVDAPDSVGLCIGSSDSTDTVGVTITGNVVRDAAQNRMADGVERALSGIMLNRTKDCIVDGNVVMDTQATKTCRYALSLVNTDRCSIGETRSVGMTVADTYSEGVNTNSRWSSAPRRVVKTADTTRNNTATVSDDPHLTGLTLSPGGVYRLSSRLIYNATTTADINVKWSVPAGTTMDWTTDSPVPTTTSPNGSIQATSQTVGSTATIGGTGVSTVGHPEGIITVGSTPGTLTMQWAQGTAEASNATLSAGSWVEIVRVA